MAESPPPAAVPEPRGPQSPSSADGLPVITPTRVVVAILVIAPFVALLWVSSYSKTGPTLGGWPFFYWYQMIWVLISAALTAIAYVLVRREEKARKALRAARAGAAEGEAEQR